MKNLTNAQVLDLIGQKIDLSSIDASVSDLLDEVESCRQAGFSMKQTAEVFAELADESFLPDQFGGGIWAI